MSGLTIADAADALRRGELTSTSLVQHCIERAEALDAELGAYVHRTDALALEAAAVADAELAEGRDLGPLHGIPLCVKDIFATADAPTTGQSLVFDRGWCSGVDATAIARLRGAGAVLTGKTTTMELAIGMPDPTKPFPIPRNPWSTERWAGGSSSGTAIAIATGMALGGPGTDTGGSIRIPSAYCGTTGLKPTFGRVSSVGCHPLASSLDHVGPMARTARDCALLLDAMAGHDPDDPFAVAVPFESTAGSLDEGIAGIRIGVDRSLLATPGVDPAAVGTFDAALAALEAAGAEVRDITVPRWNEGVAASAVTMFVESYALHRRALESRWDDFGRPTRQTMALGALVSGATYAQAQRVRRVLRREVRALFAGVDVVATLASGVGAPQVDGLGLLTTLGLPLFVSYWNGVGNPALVVPCGFDGDGLPIGLQLIGAVWDERTVLRAGHAFQQRTEWHQQTPTEVVP